MFKVQLFIWLGLLLPVELALGGPWIGADWRGKEPHFSPGSLFWKTNQFRRCPVLYRTVIDVDDNKPIDHAGLRMRASWFAYVFLNGKEITEYLQKGEGEVTNPIDVELTHLLRPGENVLAISTTSNGFSLEGAVVYEDGSRTRIESNPQRWKVMRFPPLTVLEREDCMKTDFDDSDWFPVKVIPERGGVEVSDEELRGICQRLRDKRLRRWDEDARWRLKMLIEKGFAVLDWESHGWTGPERLPEWVLNLAEETLNREDQEEPGKLYKVAETLTGYVCFIDEAVNLENHVIGLQVLKAPEEEILVCRDAAQKLRDVLSEMERTIRNGDFDQALELLRRGKVIRESVRKVRFINDLCSCLDNKFGWFDTTSLLDNDVSGWGLRFDSLAKVLASPLSPAALVTIRGRELVIRGWDELKPIRVYKKPPNTGPVCLWAVLSGRVVGLRPDESGVVYDRAKDGELSENWVLLVSDLSRGGGLPVQIVFLRHPKSIRFEMNDEGVTAGVRIEFDEPGCRLFLLKPFKEWRGILIQARMMTGEPLNEGKAERYIRVCRLWSRALLNYPITFSEAFIPDPNDRWAIIVADVYNYLKFEDEWGTKPLKLAPLPPLATYGLMRGYPGLKVLSETQNLGSRGVWGDEIDVVGENHIVYRVPLDPFKRFGGFTAFCFGPTDIGEPGSLTEIKLIKSTGANSFRPQHNQTGERAMRTLRWCLEQGLQHVFNTDEKWVPDVVEHFRTLARKCKDLPPDAVAYDLLNEPESREPHAYNVLIGKITNAIRQIDRSHLIYVETIPPWGPGAQPFPKAAFESLEVTGDPLTIYSFHDYEFRLPERWPNERNDIRDILRRWIPAFRFSIDHQTPIHLGEFGAFEQTKRDIYHNRCAITLLMDYFRIFDQFGWHFHYYSNRGTVRVREDGSLRESLVQEAFRRYSARGTFNLNRRS